MAVIAIDYTPAHEQGGGIGRYVRELIDALQAQPNDHHYRLLVAGATSPPSHPITPQFTWCTTPLTTQWLARIWHRARLPLPVEAFTGKVDLYHATDFTLPPTLPQTRTLLTVHDLSFTRTPETAHPRLRRYLERVVPRSVARADHILADSVATKQDLMALYGTPAEKITVLLSGVNHKFHPIANSTAQQSVRAKYQLGDAPYIFAVGTVQPRKNYARLVRALHQIRQQGQDIHLVIAGGRGWLEDELYATIKQLDISPFVHLIGYADDSDIPALYSAARCSAFISLYEGFGLPILESMACGTPVVTANVSSLPEVAGDAALMVNDPTDIQQIVEQLTRLLLDSQLHATLTQRGLVQAAQFTWENSARQLLTVYNQLLSS